MCFIVSQLILLASKPNVEAFCLCQLQFEGISEDESKRCCRSSSSLRGCHLRLHCVDFAVSVSSECKPLQRFLALIRFMCDFHLHHKPEQRFESCFRLKLLKMTWFDHTHWICLHHVTSFSEVQFSLQRSNGLLVHKHAWNLPKSLEKALLSIFFCLSAMPLY